MNIQHEVTDNNAVFSEDCKGSVWKSSEGAPELQLLYTYFKILYLLLQCDKQPAILQSCRRALVCLENSMSVVGITETIKAIFPPFPMPFFKPNFTGYDLDQRGYNWSTLAYTMAPSYDMKYVRTVICQLLLVL